MFGDASSKQEGGTATAPAGKPPMRGRATAALAPSFKPPKEKLRDWQLRERQARWDLVKAEERKEAQKRKTFRIKKKRRQWSSLIDAPKTTSDAWVITARLPFRKAMVYDKRRTQMRQHNVGCCMRWCLCCCLCGCCRTCLQRCSLFKLWVSTLRRERQERLRVRMAWHLSPMSVRCKAQCVVRNRSQARTR